MRPTAPTGEWIRCWKQKNQSLIRDLLESLSKDDTGSKSGVRPQGRRFLRQRMDESGIDAAGIAPLQPEFDRIYAISDRDQPPDGVCPPANDRRGRAAAIEPDAGLKDVRGSSPWRCKASRTA